MEVQESTPDIREYSEPPKIKRDRVIFAGLGGIEIFVDENRAICTWHPDGKEKKDIPFEWQRTNAEITIDYVEERRYGIRYKVDPSDKISGSHPLCNVSSKMEATAAAEAVRKAIAIHVEAIENEPRADVVDKIDANGDVENKYSQTTGRCNTCGVKMSRKNPIKFWDGRAARDVYREEWLCYECDRKLVKTC